ncbi:MAG TPA: hypothetical protein VG838_08520 [Opitutaceae bacterium]|nr:hypothetical protein [Opitutaceae bacterium]
MPDPRKLKLLVLEDKADYIESNYRSPVRDYLRRGTHDIELEVVQTKDAALAKLRESRFDGAILDLRLTGDMNEAEGNIVAKTIHAKYLMPVAIVTAFHNELDAGLRALTERPSTLFRLFNKGGDGNTVFEFFLRVDKTEVLRVFQPGGEFNAILTSVFWDHLGPIVDRVADQDPSDDGRRRILRHAIYHVLAFLQRDGEAKNWDPYLNEEVYIVPPVGANACTGEIIAAPIAGGGHGGHFLLVTPSCDIGKISAVGGYFQLVAITPFAGAAITRDTLNSIAKKTNTRYHLLPPSATYAGGIVDFWQLQNIPSATLATYNRVGQVTDPFTKDIVARLGAWISRQGSPEFQESVADQAWAKIHPPAPAAQA